MFATSTAHDGNLNGLNGADAICQARADAASLPGSYKAWLSSSSVAVSSRLTHSTQPYYMLNNLKVADNWTDLVDGSIDNAINVSETGATLPGFLPWTGSTHLAGVTSYHCMDWTSGANANFGTHGSSSRADLAWTYNIIRRCDSLLRLYCFQQ